MDVKVLTINTGSKKGNAYAVWVKYDNNHSFSFLLDAGVPRKQHFSVFSRWKKEHNIPNPSFLFVSHQHTDHALHAYDYQEMYGIKKVFVDQGFDVSKTGNPKNQFLKLQRCNAKEIWTLQSQNDIPDVLFKPFYVPHDVPNLGFQIQLEDNTGEIKTLVFATDVGNVDGLYGDKVPTVFYDIKKEKQEGILKEVLIDVMMFECNYDDDVIKNNTQKAILNNEVGTRKRNERTTSGLGHLSNIKSAYYLSQINYNTNNQTLLLHASLDNITRDNYVCFEKINKRFDKDIFIAESGLVIENLSNYIVDNKQEEILEENIEVIKKTPNIYYGR